MNISKDLVTVSIVSHRQNQLVNGLLADLDRVKTTPLQVIVTENAPDNVPLIIPRIEGLERVVNEQPKGFGANHNSAFARCRAGAFCVLNPDIRLDDDPFPLLLQTLQRPATGVVAPLVRNPIGKVEDSARRFPTLSTLICRAVRGPQGPDYPVGGGPVQVDWAAGMFLLFDSAIFRNVGGFDERYFMYYEDADICRRIGKAGHVIVYDPRVEVIHDARRGSHRDPRLAAHHLASIARFFFS